MNKNILFNLYIRNLALSLFFLIITAFVIAPAYGFYDYFASFVLSGASTGMPLVNTYHLGFYPLTFITSFFYSFMPTIPWLGVFLLISWGLVINNISFTFYQILGFSNIKEQITVVITSFLSLFLLSFIEFSAAGISVLLTSSSLILFWLLLKQQKYFYKIKHILFFLLFVFILGLAWRLEMALIAIFFTCFLLLFLSNRKQIKFFALPVFISLFFAFIVNNTTKENYFFDKIDWMIFYIVDSQNQYELEFDSENDRVKYETVMMSFFSDLPILNKKFYDEILEIKKKEDIKSFISIENILNKTSEKLLNAVGLNLNFSLYYILLIALLLFFSVFYYDDVGLRRIFFCNISIFLLICLLAYTMKMERWHYIPLLQMSIMLTSVVFIEELVSSSTILKLKHIYIGILLLFPALFFLTFKEKSAKNMELAQKKIIKEKIYQEKKDRYVFLDANSREILDDYVFTKNMRFQNLYFYDMAQLTFLQEYKSHLDDFCKCDAHDMRQFFTFLSQVSEKVDYYGVDYRVEKISQYLKQIHEIDVKFIIQSEFPLDKNIIGGNKIFKYSIDFQ